MSSVKDLLRGDVVDGSGTANYVSKWSDADTITNSNIYDNGTNVGIGTSSPAYKLEVAATTTPQIAFRRTGTADGNGEIFSIGSTGVINSKIVLGQGSNKHMLFEVNGTERMRITSGGAVLFGTTVEDPATGSGVEGIKTNTLGKGFLAATGNSSLGDTFNYYNTTAGAYRFYVNNAGTIFATNTTISAISDARLKENVQDLTGGLDAIMSLKPKVFDWKAESGNEGKGVRGFIAQEVEEVFPEYVNEYKSGNIPEDGIPYKSVRQDFIPFLVKAIQEQQEIINDLKSRIEILENK